MPEPFWFTPTQVPENMRIFVKCQSCGDVRGVGRFELAAKAGDIPMREIEPKLRCTNRLRKPGRPICGGRGVFDLARAPRTIEEAHREAMGLKD